MFYLKYIPTLLVYSLKLLLVSIHFANLLQKRARILIFRKGNTRSIKKAAHDFH